MIQKLQIFFLAILSGAIYGQELDGLWLQHYEEVPVVREGWPNIIFEEDSILIVSSEGDSTRMAAPPSSNLKPQNDSINKIDYYTTYDFGGIYLIEAEFSPKKDSASTIHYTREGNRVKLMTSDTTVFAELTGEHLILPYRDGGRIYHSYFIKASPSKGGSLTGVDSVFFTDSYYRLSTDSTSLLNGVQVHFTKEGYPVTQYSSTTHSLASAGYAQFRNLWDEKFLLLDILSSDFYYFRFLDKQGENLLSEVYEDKWTEEDLPVLRKVKWVKVPFPNSGKMDSIKEKLIGTWEANISERKREPHFSQFDSLKNEQLVIHFLDSNTFTVDHSALTYSNGEGKKIKLQYKGAWKLGETGTYLELIYTGEKSNETVSITKLSAESALLNMVLESFDNDGAVMFHTTVQLDFKKISTN